VVEAFAIFPEMFCSAKDCACRPPTEVLSASKIPITPSPNSIYAANRKGKQAAFEEEIRKRYAKVENIVISDA
jgi:hypothetical protein